MEKIYFFNAFTRLLRGRSHSSNAGNEMSHSQRGEILRSLSFREATPEDISALATLHVAVWNEANPGVRHKPSLEMREAQWEEAFRDADNNWFCYVIENRQNKLVGFAQGNLYYGRIAGFDGQLGKFWVLRSYQHMGLERKLLGYVSRRFLSRGIFSMIVFADAGSRDLYEALGAEKLSSGKGEFRWAYGWSDLEALAAECPIG
jgi:ribosomal protein S18 acetylase RimI-like enzyme